ncbi:Bgt-2867 [Blumeria graminis f. sp. tritici]|uniref:Bgt-2867 n=2 Tax=Blumeria graminis f. sp. tritici TaxID=62690 RepID=A0A381L3W8_BLUGR|nr:ER membrane protein [Blumeria graminis f. sp. tritici 96224]VCU39050.1 Bgt-2867 [Blumeria graminis f. sp. tritici]
MPGSHNIMYSRTSCCHRLTITLFIIVFLYREVSAAATAYCSEINTSNEPSNNSVYQSNGLCTNFCQKDYAFAVLQNQDCWCSNFIPATTTDGCTVNCPGYPFEQCGGVGLYGYIALGHVSPSGTIGSSSVEQTSTTAPPPQATSTSIITTSITSLTPTPVTSVRTISGSGSTVTIIPLPPPTSQASEPAYHNDGSRGLSTGAAVGLTAGLVALVATICSITYFCLRKRKERGVEDLSSIGDRRGSSAELGGHIASRTMSENSRYVLGTDGRRVVETWESKDETGHRKSRLIPVDPRLDPFAPVYRIDDNKSRESINTLRDDLDYSRRVHGGQRGPILRATNPDEDD